MNTEKDKAFIQCLNCGHIYVIERKISIEVSIVGCECPRCEWYKGLNCGNKKEDIYYFYDSSLDERYYKY